ncbi:MAG: hypothetical protein ACTSXP_00440, partial [Promethearchaeota archaeon]
RLMTIKKMRGVLIKNKRYVYTLANGRVHVLSPFITIPSRKPGDFAKQETSADNVLSSGNKDLDSIVDITKGSTLNIEMKKYKGIQSLVVPILIILQNDLANIKDICPEYLNRIDHDGILAPFFKKGIVTLKSDDLTINIYHSEAAVGNMELASPDYHLVIDSTLGIPLLYGESPYTNLHAINISIKENIFSYNLIPIV